MNLEYLLFSVAIYLAGYILSRHFKKAFFSIIPASLHLGIVGGIVLNTCCSNIDFMSFSNLAFHLFNLSVISVTISTSIDLNILKNRRSLYGIVWMTGIFTAVLCIQSFTGFGSIIIYEWLNGEVLNDMYGFLTGHALAQGSGHIVAIGTVWESKYNLAETVSIGLMFSAIGYLIAILAGIPILSKRIEEQKFERVDPSVKSFFRSFVLTGVLYAISLLVFTVTKLILNANFFIGNRIAEELEGILPGLVFAIGIFCATIYKRMFENEKNNSQELNDSQKYLSSHLFDLFLFFALISIDFSAIFSVGRILLVVPFVSSLSTVIFFLVLNKLSSVNDKELRLIALLGTCFGSLANGFFLLKLRNPELDSPVIFELTMMNMFTLVSLTHITLIIFALGSFGNIYLPAGIYLITFIVSLTASIIVEKRMN